MSDKLIRDELLRSHRYVSLSNDTAKLLFLHLTLASDSLSNAEATTTALSIIMGRHITETAAGTLLSELSDHDLVRTYEANGKRYVHIPRSRQRIRYLRGKHPRPPVGIEDSEIKELIAKVGLQSDRGQTQVGPPPPEVEVLLPLKRSTETRKSKPLSSSPNGTANIDAVRLLEFLNAKTGRKFRPSKTTLKPIIARLAEYSVDECRAVIVRRWVKWRDDDKMRDYLRPSTLFGDTNFAQYIGDVPTPEEMKAMEADQ